MTVPVPGIIVPAIVIKSRTQDDCYVLLILNTEYIALLPKDKAQKTYRVGDTLFAYVESCNGWRIIVSQKDPAYVTAILKGIFALEKTIQVVKAVKVSKAPFYKAAIKHSSLTVQEEVVSDTLRQIRGILPAHVTEQITFAVYDNDIEQYVINALAPGKRSDVKRVYLWHDEKKVSVFVDASAKATFLGPKGLNAASASKLTGWAIEII